jgi:hypothetical protein
MLQQKDIISGEKFQQLCDVYCGVPWHLERNPIIRAQTHKHLNLENLVAPYNNPRLVFCYSCSLELLMEKIHLFQNKFVLVSHNEDENVTEKYLPLANHPLVVKWFAQNLMVDHDKVEMLPIGLANAMWPHGNIEHLINICKMTENMEKTNDFFFNFSISTNESKRMHCKQELEKKGLSFNSHIPREIYLQTLATYKFVICPEGNGVDCHRIWEAYYLNTIPIMLKNQFSLHLQNILPCILLDKWEDLNKDFCLKYYEEYVKALQYSKQYLLFNTYKDRIQKYVSTIIEHNTQSSAINIVYSFIGPLPKYSEDTVFQLRLFYNGPIYFIISDYNNPLVSVLQNKYSVTFVKYSDVYHEEFNNVVRCVANRFVIVDKLAGREKIFIYSFERFFILANFMKKYNIQNVFFPELDNLIYCNPNEWLEQFSKKEMAFMYDNDESFASGISYIKTYTFLEIFLNHCIEYIIHSPKFCSEMFALASFYPKHKEDILLLPIHWENTNIPKEAYENYNMFKNTVFDAAAMGVYLGGNDPYHTQGVIVKHVKNKWSKIDYTQYTFKWEKDECSRLIPYVFTGNNWLRINNLHIHSKDLRSHLSIPIQE